MSETNNVVEFDGITSLDIPPPRIFAKAAGAKLESVVVIGFQEDGNFYFASSMADGGDALWLLELAKKKLLDIST